MFDGGVCVATENRIFRAGVIHPVDADRYVVVGRLLD